MNITRGVDVYSWYIGVECGIDINCSNIIVFEV